MLECGHMQRIWKHRFRRTTLFLLLFLSILGGVAIARSGYALSGTMCWLGLLFCLPAWRKQHFITLLMVVFFGLSLGWWRGSVYMHKLAGDEAQYYQKTTITVRATNDALYDKHKQLAFDADYVQFEDGHKLTGKIKVSGFGENAVFEGDEVAVSGKLYPSHGAYQGKINFALLRVTFHHPSWVAEIRRKFASGMQTALPEPLAPFAMGLLVGQRSTIPNGVKQDLLVVGLTHIIAVSGYNLTIILHASRKLFVKKSKRISTFLSFSLIAVFLLLAGASASIVRAAMVSVLSIVSEYYGRTFKPLNLIALAAATTALANPFYVWGDLSWYLSFLAFFGVMVLAPLIKNRWPGRWHDSLVAGVALESISAEIMSLPLILYVFGQMSLIGLPANVLVVVLVPLAMLLSLIAGLAGMLVGAVSGWFTWPASLLLSYMLDIAHLMAHIPHVFIQNRSLSLVAMLGLYAVIVFVAGLLRLKTKAT